MSGGRGARADFQEQAVHALCAAGADNGCRIMRSGIEHRKGPDRRRSRRRRHQAADRPQGGRKVRRLSRLDPAADGRTGVLRSRLRKERSRQHLGGRARGTEETRPRAAELRRRSARESDRGRRADGGETMKKQYRSRVFASVHETAEGLTAAGVMSKQTMREFDELCLTPVRPLSPEEIRELREREGASQAVFARYLNVTTGLVSQWERGEKHPQGASLKLLALIAKNGLSGVA